MKPDDLLKKWALEVTKKSGPRIEEATVFTALATKNFMKNPQCALELGLAVLMDKPIILIADHNEKLPENLIKIARAIQRVDLENPEDMRKAAEAVANLADQVEIETNSN